jgi:hypothetical protein
MFKLVLCHEQIDDGGTYSKGPNVRHKREVGTVTGVKEESHTSNQTNQGRLAVAVGEANGD